MSRRTIVGWIVLWLVVAVGTIAAWTLRQPIKEGVGLIAGRDASESTVRFAVLGDNHGVNDVYRQAIMEIGQESVDFFLNLADTSEFGTESELTAVAELEKKLPFPVYHTVGNHDIKTDGRRGLFTQVFGQSPNQSLTFKNFHLIILDNADRKVGFSDTTLSWLEQDLKKNNGKTIMIAYHRPFDLPLAAVIGDDETAVSRASNNRFLEIIQPYAVSYILTAHLHTYLQYTVGGIPAVISGGGGDPAQTILGGPAANYFHYLVVTVKGAVVTHEVRRIRL